MRRFRTARAVALVALGVRLAAGCGGAGAGPDDGGGADTGVVPDAAADGAADSVAAEVADATADALPDAAQAVVHVSGVTYKFDSPDPLAGTVVRVAEYPDVEAVSDEQGRFALAVPAGAPFTPYASRDTYQTMYLQTFPGDGDVERVYFQMVSEGTFIAFAAVLGVEPRADRCQVASTVSVRDVQTLDFEAFTAFGHHGVAGAVITSEPPLPDVFYFDEETVPTRTLTETTIDGGVVWTNVPPGVYTLHALHPTRTFAPFTATCEPGRFINASPPWGLREAQPPPPAQPGALWDPRGGGPWLAGVRTLTLTDATRDRVLPVDVWYPVDPAAAGGTDNEYVLDTDIGVLGRVASPARRDAPPAALGPRPLVVFSHGFGGIRFQSPFLTEHLARHGFVVAAPDHVGNRLSDFALLNDDEAIAQSAAHRPLDVAFVRDTLLADPAWDLDPARVAVSGHSFGGWTCVEAAARDEEGWAAVVALAPGFLHGATPERAADVRRPLCILGGTADRTTPFEEAQQPAYDAAAAPKLLVALDGAGHFDFTLLCDLPVAAPIVDGDGCDAASADWHLVHARTNTVAAAFLRTYLEGDGRYAPFLAPARIAGFGGAEAWFEP